MSPSPCPSPSNHLLDGIEEHFIRPQKIPKPSAQRCWMQLCPTPYTTAGQPACQRWDGPGTSTSRAALIVLRVATLNQGFCHLHHLKFCPHTEQLLAECAKVCPFWIEQAMPFSGCLALCMSGRGPASAGRPDYGRAGSKVEAGERRPGR